MGIKISDFVILFQEMWLVSCVVSKLKLVEVVGIIKS